MRKKHLSRSAFFNLRALIGFSLCLLAAVLTLLALDVPVSQSPETGAENQSASNRRPHERAAVGTARSFDGDLRRLRFGRVAKKERPEREPPPFIPRLYQPPGG